MLPQSKFVDIGFNMHIREWQAADDSPDRQPFLLIHGLASNAQTWDGVAAGLAAAGHMVVAMDQRGHGLSDKLPVSAGYDFDTVTEDINTLLDTLGWEAPIIAGQSWGGNVVLAFGANHPGRASGFIFVDGGFLVVKQHAPVWEEAYELFKPPPLTGISRSDLRRRLQEFQPEWSADGIESTLANFETLPDGTIRPWLSLDRHMTIFRALWEQDPTTLYDKIQEPLLICPAGSGHMGDKRVLVEAACSKIARAEVKWFPDTAHDIHVHRPVELAQVFLEWAARQSIVRGE